MDQNIIYVILIFGGLALLLAGLYKTNRRDNLPVNANISGSMFVILFFSAIAGILGIGAYFLIKLK